jgi:putative ABC transport system substrate-binding protein
MRQISAFLQGLRDLGFVEGRDFDITYRFAEGYLDRQPALAREVVDLKPNVILAAATEAAIQVKALTGSISLSVHYSRAQSAQV